jgi:hypothetical protein
MYRLFQLAILAIGGTLRAVGLPVTLLAAACGMGGTLEYWLRPRCENL